MITFTKKSFDSYCRRFPSEFRSKALKVATMSGDSVAISRADFDAIRKNFRLVRKSQKPFGLGDAVAAIANPIARALDATLGTKIERCGGCARRREALNQILPNLVKPHKSDGQ